MRLATILRNGQERLAAYAGDLLLDLSEAGSGLPDSMIAFLMGGAAART